MATHSRVPEIETNHPTPIAKPVSDEPAHELPTHGTDHLCDAGMAKDPEGALRAIVHARWDA